MSSLRFLYRLLGTLWIVVGLLIVLIAIGYVLAARAMDVYFVSQWPELAAIVGPLLERQSSLQQWASLAFGLFCLVFGVGMLCLRSWARTVGVAFNVAMGACLAVLVLLVYSRLTEPGPLQQLVPRAWPRWLALSGGLLSFGLLAAGIHLSTAPAMDAFFGVPPAMPPLPPVKCPTCGERLDLAKARCPRCDSEEPADIGPARARLVDVQTNHPYQVSMLHLTRIGRDNPAAEIQLEDPTVSHEHAQIEYLCPRFYLHALRDLNGTYVNEVRIRDAEIKDGDRIAFGKAQFRFVVEDRD